MKNGSARYGVEYTFHTHHISRKGNFEKDAKSLIKLIAAATN